MPSGDIMPWKSPLGGTYEVREVGLTTGQVYLRGHPVGIVDAGTLTEAPHDISQWLINDIGTGGDDVTVMNLGIACQSVGVDDGDGTVSSTARAGFPVPINPATGAIYVVNDSVSFWPAGQGTVFITKNFHDAGTTNAVVPVVGDIGQQYTLSSSATSAAGFGWGVEQTAATIGTDVIAVVVEVLDAQKSPIRKSGNAGVYVLFEMELTMGVVA